MDRVNAVSLTAVGAALLVAGVLLVFGLGWALIVGGLGALAAAVLLSLNESIERARAEHSTDAEVGR